MRWRRGLAATARWGLSVTRRLELAAAPVAAGAAAPRPPGPPGWVAFRALPPGPVDPQAYASSPRDGQSAGRLIMVLLLASLAMGFAALLVLYFVFRAQAPAWPPPGMPALPRGLWVSTALLVGTSVSLQVALRAVRRGRAALLRRALLTAGALAVAFLVSQGVNWLWGIVARLPPERSLYVAMFYLLTGLHALHVLGGIVPLGIVVVRSFAGRYTVLRHAGLTYCVIYWHFLDAMWLLVFATLLIGPHIPLPRIETLVGE